MFVGLKPGRPFSVAVANSGFRTRVVAAVFVAAGEHPDATAVCVETGQRAKGGGGGRGCGVQALACAVCVRCSASAAAEFTRCFCAVLRGRAGLNIN